MFVKLIEIFKKFFGIKSEDFELKYKYEKARADKAEEKFNFICRQLQAVMKQVDKLDSGDIK